MSNPRPARRSIDRHSLRVLTRDQLETFHRDGVLFIPGVFSKAEMAEALAASDQITYGMSFAEWSKKIAAGEIAEQIADGISAQAKHGRAQFPSGVAAIDRIVENETFLDIACDVLGTDDLHYLNAHLFVRPGPTDKRHSEHPWQGYHIDFDTCSFLPPWIRPGFFDYIGIGVMFHDIDLGCAPMQSIPGSHHQMAKHMTEWQKEGLIDGSGQVPDIRKIPGLAKPIPCVGSAGTVGVSSTYHLHAAIPFSDKTQQRALWGMNVARAETQGWTRFHTPYGSYFGNDREIISKYWAQTTPRVRSLFGWPKPGHPYYTPDTIERLERKYPGMDVSAYR